MLRSSSLLFKTTYVLRMSVDKINDNGLEMHPGKSSRNPEVHLTDIDFADNIAFNSSSLFNAQNLQPNVLVYILMNLKLSISIKLVILLLI